MRILWLTINRSNRIAHHFDDFRKTVSELPEVEVVTLTKPAFSGGSNIWKQSKQLISGELETEKIVHNYLSTDPHFDFIFCDAFFAYTKEDWNLINIPSSILIEDVHNEVPKMQVSIAKELGIQTIFHRFNFAFHKYHPRARFNFNCVWLPHSIRMDRFSDHALKLIDVLHVGVYRKGYPFRRFIVDTLSNKSYFKLIDRPQDVDSELRSSKWPIDRDYDNLLQKAFITATGGSAYNAPVQKYFEIPAANSLLVSNWFPDLGLLGFIPGTNMISCYKENLVDTIESLLDNREEISRISNNGYNLILLKHTSEIRAKQFVNSIYDLLSMPKIYDTHSCSFQPCFKPDKKIKEDIKEKVEDKKLTEVPNQRSIPISISKSIPRYKVIGPDWKSRISNPGTKNA